MNSKSKKALKNIVKECLIEILAEGLVGNKKQATLSESREFRGAMQESYERSENRQISERSLTEVQSSQVTKARPATHRKNFLLR
jgi:altronate dehydratase